MKNGESGKGNLGLIIFILLLAFGIYFLVQYVPPRVNAMQFKDEMNRYNTDPDLKLRRFPPDQVQDLLFKKAQELKLPIKKEQIKVGTTGGGDYRIDVSFQVPVDLKITTIYQKYDFSEPRNL